MSEKSRINSSSNEIFLSDIELLKKQLLELKSENEKLLKYKQGIEVSSDGLWEWNLETDRIFYSANYKTRLGYDATEDLSDSYDGWKNRVHPDDLEQAVEAMNNYLNAKASVYSTQYRIRTKNSDYIWIHDEGKATAWDSQGKAVKIVGIHKSIEDKKKTEENLYRAENLYSSFVKASPDALTITDLSGKIIYASPQSNIMFGYNDSEDICGRNILEFTAESVREKAGSDIAEMFKRDLWGAREYIGLKNDGEHFPIEVNGSFIKDEAGNPVNLIFIIRDVSERKRTEERYKALFEQSIEAFIIVDDLKIIECNKACETLIGLPREEIIDRTPLDFSPEIQQNGQKSVVKVVSLIEETFKQKSIKDEWLIYGPDQTIRTLDVSLALLYFEEKKVVQIAFRDITKEKEAEIRLRTLQRAVDQSPVSIVITNTLGNIEYVNPKAIETTGYSREELLGHNPRVLQSGETQKDEYKILWETIENGSAWRGFFHNKKKSGELYWESSTIAPVFDDDGSVTHYVAIKEDITERKKAEEELTKFRTISDRANYGTAIADPAGNLIYLNEAFARLHGYSPEELMGKPLTIFHTQEQMNEVNKLLKLIASEGGFTSKEVWHVKADGTEFPTLMNAALIRNEKGEPAYFSANIIDITEKKEAEEIMRQQNERLNAIVEAIPDLIFVLDKQGTYIDLYTSGILYNDKIRRDDVVGKHIADIFPADKIDFHLSKINKCTENQEVITYEYVLKTDDVNKHYEARLAPMGNNRVLSLVRDISTNKINYETINRLSLAVKQSPAGVVVTSFNGDITFINPAFTEMTGYTFDEIMGKSTRILKSGKNPPEMYDDLWKTITSGKVWKNEWINRKKNGDLYWESVSVSPILDENGEIINFLSIKQDISQRKKDLQQILDLNQNLEKKILERTFEIAQVNQNLLVEIDERTKAEVALREKTDELEKFFGVALDLLCIADTEGNFLKVNKSWSDILGYPISELENKRFLDFVHPDDLDETLKAMKSLQSQQPIMNFTNRYRTNDGNYKWIEWRSTPVGDRIYAAARDITERKRNEEFELELLHLSTKLTALPHSEVKKGLDMALSRIGNFLDADRTYIFEFDNNPETMTNTYEWCNEGVEPSIGMLVNLPCSMFPEWMKKLANHETIVIPSVSDLPDSWKAERDILQVQDIKSVIVMPLYSENNLIGFVGIDMVKKSKLFSESEINILNIWGGILNSLLSAHYADQLLELARQNFEVFFNTVDDFLWVLDEKGSIIHVNNTVIDRLGYSAQELKERSVLMVHPAERREEAGRIVAEMLSGGAEFCPVPVVSKSGMIIPVETRVKTGKWNGKFAIFGVSKDISKIQLSEQKFSKAFESGSAIMAISDFETGEYIDVNKTFVDTLGFERKELVGKSNQLLKLFVDNKLRDKIISQLADNKPIRDIEVLIRTKGAEIRTVLLSADSIFIGERKCLLTVSVDITARKNAEEEIKLARIEAEKANIAKSEFLSRMSHELRTPMNSILGFAQLLEMGELNQSQKKGVHHILSSGKHLLNLINEVLDISRIESGKLSLSIEPVKLSSVITEMLDVVHPLAQNSGIKLDFSDTGLNEVYVKADRQSLKQIILNLLSNAIKYNKPNGSVAVKCEKSGSVDTVRILVSDTGVGIPAEFLSRVFDPFERIGSDKTGIEGTGLGLSVVQKLTTAQGGTVGVESVVGEGSVFWIELQSAVNLKRNVIAQIEKSTEVQALLHTGTVLYVEDNESNIELIEHVIDSQRPGIRLVCERYGSKALSLALDIQPDLILLDMNLPDIHGSEVLKILKSNQSTHDIPVVVISADAMTSQVEKVMQSGAEAYLTKPLDIMRFIEILDMNTGN
ncbi:MAG: PAS domain S-box protein [Paludibacteraceae bacterium]|nr:PAS domain S-box protein [Paludibacteraceae bacterium]